MLGQTGLSNTLLAVILPALVNPFGVFLMTDLSRSAAIPDELLDAGRVDGAGEFRIFAAIAFRLLAPGVRDGLLFAFVGAWNNFFLPLLVLREPGCSRSSPSGWRTGTRSPRSPARRRSLYAIVITGSVVAVLPVMVLFLFLQRYWQRGLALGSVRG